MFDAAAVLQNIGGLRCELSCDSRDISRGEIFLAYPGENSDGRMYIADALSAGAAGVLWEPEEFSWPPQFTAPNAPVPHLAERAGVLANVAFGEPSRRLFAAAITGTNGKTTAALFAAQLLSQGGLRAGVIGTLGAGFANEKMNPQTNTTPSAVSLQKLLRDFANNGARAAIMEASSHGIVQKRLAGICLSAAALLNIGRDHLDYHGDEKSYRRAKLALLRSEGLREAVINADEEFAAEAMECCGGSVNVRTFGVRGGALRLVGAKDAAGGQTLELDGENGRRKCFLPMRGTHNAYNFMAAVLIANSAGVCWEAMRPEELSPPCGRLQRVNPGGAPAVYVDYAHTPDALFAALSSFSGRRGRLYLIFGCGGARDRGKRRRMGKIAAALADVAIITDDNPRDEDPQKIRADIAAGAKGFREISERGEAIAVAISEAAKEDIVLIAGKGHEEYQIVGDIKIPFSDLEVAKSALSAGEGAGRC